MTVPPPEAKFCTGCGAPVGARRETAVPAATPAASELSAGGDGAAPIPDGPRACPGCGVLQASKRDTCEVCNTAHSEGSIPLPRDDKTYWVAVRCRFQCRSCGHISPLDHLDMDGSVTCLRCGLDQHFDVASWNQGLDHAMRVGLLAGKHGKYALVGQTSSTLEHVQSGMKIEAGMVKLLSLRVSAGPGHPLCQQCRVPLVVEVEGDVATSRCPTCGTGMRCVLPQQARRACKAVRAVLAEELASDRPSAKVEGNSHAAGAVAITCPHCSAPLRVTGSASIVTCEYCRTSSRIPRRTMFQLGHDHPVPQVWWLQFSTADAQRIAGPRQPKQPPRQVQREVVREQVVDKPSIVGPPPRDPAGPGISLGLAVFALVGLFGFREHLARWRSGPAPSSEEGSAAPSVEAPSTSQDSTGTETPPAKRPPPVPYAPLDCSCGGMHLAAFTKTTATGATIRLAAGRKDEGFELGELEVSKRALGLGLACEGDRLVIAFGTEAWGFSISERSLAWRTELPAAYRYVPDEPARGVAIRCRRMPLVGHNVNVPIAPKSFARVSLETGVVARRR